MNSKEEIKKSLKEKHLVWVAGFGLGVGISGGNLPLIFTSLLVALAIVFYG